MKPITPSEATKNKEIPPFVIECFNALIKKEFNGSSARVMQEDVVRSILAHPATKEILKITRSRRGEIFDRGWLDVESVYHKVGWKVVYDKPAFNEDYEPFFVFTRRR